MNKYLTGLCASTLALSFAVTGVMPTNAAPLVTPQSMSVPSDIQNIQFNGDFRVMQRRGPRGDFRGRGHGYEQRGNSFYYNGHRGYRHSRQGYRELNGVWFPLAAFAAGAIISGAINNPPQPVYRERVYRGGNAHVQYCYDRYKSYRASDNTFQPYNGPRQQCYSPY